MRAFGGIARFRTHAGVSDTEFLAIEMEIRAVICTRPGFLRRQLGKFADGARMVQMLWDSPKARTDWTAYSKTDPVLQRQHAMIDFASMEM